MPISKKDINNRLDNYAKILKYDTLNQNEDDKLDIIIITAKISDYLNRNDLDFTICPIKKKNKRLIINVDKVYYVNNITSDILSNNVYVIKFNCKMSKKEFNLSSLTKADDIEGNIFTIFYDRDEKNYFIVFDRCITETKFDLKFRINQINTEYETEILIDYVNWNYNDSDNDNGYTIE